MGSHGGSDNEENLDSRERVDGHYIFLIDARENMQNGNENLVLATISALIEVIKNLVLQKVRIKIGIAIFGSETKNIFLVENVWLLCPLKEPEAETIHLLKHLIKKQIKSFGGDGIVPLKGALQTCSLLFESESSTDSNINKKVFIFTNDEKLFKSSVDETSSEIIEIKQIFNSLFRAGVKVGITDMSKDNSVSTEKFDKALFYKRFDCQENDPKISVESIDEILNGNFDNCQSAKLQEIDFFITKNLQFKVQIYKLFARENLRQPITVHATKLENFLKEYLFLDKTTGESFEKTKIINYIKYKNKEIFVTKEVNQMLKNPLMPGIHVLGFKSMDEVAKVDRYGPPYVLYPCENARLNEKTMFASLLKSMLDKNVVGVCRVKLKTEHRLRYGLIIPQKGAFLPSSEKNIPFGLKMSFISFAEERKKTDLSENVATLVPENLIEAAIGWLDEVPKVDKNADIYQNPSIKLQNRVLQAIVLEENEEIETTLPKIEQSEALHNKILNFLSKVPKSEEVEHKMTDWTSWLEKRLRFGGQENLDDETHGKVVKKLKLMKKDELKEILNGAIMDDSGLKEELIGRISKCLRA